MQLRLKINYNTSHSIFLWVPTCSLINSKTTHDFWLLLKPDKWGPHESLHLSPPLLLPLSSQLVSLSPSPTPSLNLSFSCFSLPFFHLLSYTSAKALNQPSPPPQSSLATLSCSPPQIVSGASSSSPSFCHLLKLSTSSTLALSIWFKRWQLPLHLLQRTIHRGVVVRACTKCLLGGINLVSFKNNFQIFLQT